MADSLGALQEQAAEIPYKNIAVNTSAVDGFINAWSTATQLKLKRQEVEGRMAALAEKNRQLEISGDLKEKQFNLRAMMDQNTIAHQGQMYDLAVTKAGNLQDYQNREIGLREAAMNFKDDMVNKRTDDTAGFYQDMSSVDPNDPDFERKVSQIMATHPNVPASSRNIIARQAWGQHKNAYDSQYKWLESEQKNIRTGLSNDLFGVGNKGDTSILDAPDKYFVPHYQIKGGRSVAWEERDKIDPATGKKYMDEFILDKNRQAKVDPSFRSFKVPDPNDPSKIQYKPIAVQKLNDYTRRKQAADEGLSKLGPRPYNPEMGVTGRDPSDRDLQELRTSKNPDTRRNFDAHFGEGASDRYAPLNNGQ